MKLGGKNFRKAFGGFFKKAAPVAAGAGAVAAMGATGGAIAPLLGPAAGLAQGYMGLEGAKDANKASLESSREQMAFQERMSSTAHQREVADLRAAGLNPVLAAGGGGSSSPSGASFDAENEAAPLAAGVEAAVSTALESQRLRKDISEATSRIKLNEEQVRTQSSLRELQDAQTSSARALAGKNEAESETAKNRAAVERQHPEVFGTLDAVLDRVPSGLLPGLLLRSVFNQGGRATRLDPRGER